MIRTIVCGIDGTGASIHAAGEAMKLLGKDGLISLVAAVPENDFAVRQDPELPVEITKALEENVLPDLRRAASDMGLEARAEVLGGSPFKRILEKADQESADLVVLGQQKDPEHLMRRVVGTTASRVIGHTSRDVLIVPEGSSLSLGRIIAATDGSEHGNLALDKAASLAADSGGEVTALVCVHLTAEAMGSLPLGGMPHVPTKGSPVMEQANVLRKQVMEQAEAMAENASERASASGVKSSPAVRYGLPAREICEQAKEESAGLVVMGSHGRTGLSRLLMGSVTERVLETSPSPVLVTVKR